jgi:holo-[acyl-carrier protein] synthase
MVTIKAGHESEEVSLAMAIIGHGVDVVEVGRINDLIERHGEHFLHRCFTTGETDYCREYRDSSIHFAGRFAAKEAIVKALGTGFRGRIAWTDMEILPDSKGKPVLRLTGHTACVSQQAGITAWHISISHTAQIAFASAIAEQ